jgi:hypothetical protein
LRSAFHGEKYRDGKATLHVRRRGRSRDREASFGIRNRGSDDRDQRLLYLSPSQQAVEARHAEMHFDLSQCQPVQANVYKCPAVDKAICGREYSGPPIDCLAIDSKGNLLVEVR